MSEHTPGPWAVNPVIAQVDAFERGIPIPVCAMVCPTDLRTEAATMANGTLIAAAPTMLDELKQCATELEEAANIMTAQFPGLASIYRAARDRALGTVAKAEGRAE